METTMLKKFVIERDIPKVGSLDHTQLSGVAANSNGVLEKMGGKVEWVNSLVAVDKKVRSDMPEHLFEAPERSRRGPGPVRRPER